MEVQREIIMLNFLGCWFFSGGTKRGCWRCKRGTFGSGDNFRKKEYPLLQWQLGNEGARSLKFLYRAFNCEGYGHTPYMFCAFAFSLEPFNECTDLKCKGSPVFSSKKCGGVGSLRIYQNK